MGCQVLGQGWAGQTCVIMSSQSLDPRVRIGKSQDCESRTSRLELRHFQLTRHPDRREIALATEYLWNLSQVPGSQLAATQLILSTAL